MVVICEQCGKSFAKPCKLKLHVETVHLKLKNFKCTFCEIFLASSVALKNHVIRKHQNNCDYNCEDCDRSFKTQSGLDQHLNVHDKGKTFCCSECNLVLKHRTLFKNHMKKHEMMNDTTCKICQKTYATHQRMKEHVYNTHRKNPILKCSFCNKKYFLQATLDKHLASHTILVCDICAFKAEKDLMTKHILKHLKVPNEKCTIISSNFRKKSTKEKKTHIKDAAKNVFKETDVFEQDPLTNPLEIEKIETREEKVKTLNTEQRFESQNLFSPHYEESHNSKIVQQLATKQADVKQLPQMYCQLCCKMGKSREEMKNHFIEEHKQHITVDCELCWFTFMTQQALQDHLGMVHNHKFSAVVKKKIVPKNKIQPKLRIKCPECEHTFSSISTFNNHKAVKHSKIPKHPCKICYEHFFTLDQVYNHSKKVHDGGSKLTRKCGVCQLEFIIAQDFYDHIATHESSLICRMCGENPKDEEAAKKHQISHRKIDEKYKKVVCEICGKKFVNESMLKVHMFHHSTEKTFMCNYPDCGKSFRFQASYCIHKNSHNKKIECHVCHRMFATKQSLYHHSLSHSGIKPFHCKICNKKYSSLSMVAYCKKKHDGTLPEIPCKLCGKTFTSKFFLKSHMVLQHEKTKDFTCAGCGEAFSFMKQLENHTANKCSASSSTN